MLGLAQLGDVMLDLMLALSLCAPTTYVFPDGTPRKPDKFDRAAENNNRCAERIPGKPCMGKIILHEGNHRHIICVAPQVDK